MRMQQFFASLTVEGQTPTREQLLEVMKEESESDSPQDFDFTAFYGYFTYADEDIPEATENEFAALRSLAWMAAMKATTSAQHAYIEIVAAIDLRQQSGDS